MEQAATKLLYIDRDMEKRMVDDLHRQDAMFDGRIKQQVALMESRIMCEIHRMENKQRGKRECKVEK